MEEFPNYTFAASQAQQFEWVENLYPKLFEKIKKKEKDGQFIPIGGILNLFFIFKVLGLRWIVICRVVKRFVVNSYTVSAILNLGLANAAKSFGFLIR